MGSYMTAVSLLRNAGIATIVSSGNDGDSTGSSSLF
jgi:hypothetical protein